MRDLLSRRCPPVLLLCALVAPLLLAGCFQVSSVAPPRAAVSVDEAVGAPEAVERPTVNPRDWSQWRGAEQTGVSREKDLPEKWSAKGGAGSNLIWRVPIGGRTTPIVMNGRVYAIAPDGEGVHTQERVVCLDDKDGSLVWEHKFNVFHTAIVEDRVGWTNVVGDPETGNVYAHGVQGLLFCFEGKTGKVIWEKSLTEEFGRVSGYGGRVNSPIIDGDLVILGMINANWGEYARGGNRFLALDKKSGDVVWWSETGLPVKSTYYSNPIVAVINGQRVFVTGGGDGAVHAFQVRTGKKLWSHIFCAGGVNVTPVVDGNYVYIGHGEENLDVGERGRIVCLDAGQVTDGKPKVVWEHTGVNFKFASPIVLDGKLYIADEGGTLYCYDAKTGKELWNQSYGTATKTAPVWADGKIYAATVEGKFCILKPTDSGCDVLDAKELRSRIKDTVLEINGGIAVANGRVYFMTSQDLFCLGKPNHTTKPDALPESAHEAKPAAGAKPAQLQVIPADVTLAPGGTATFQARVFDADGHFLRDVKPDWEAAPFLAPPAVPGVPVQPGPAPPKLDGEVTKEGKLTVSKLPGQFGGVVAKADGLEAHARIRVAPPLSYSQDFEKVPENRTPGGWVAAQGKFAVKDLAGTGKVLAKNNTVPNILVARAMTFITNPDSSDYTITVDVMGRKKKDDVPEIGIINSRYTLEIEGATQSLHLQSWDALPRIKKSVPLAWKPDVWYTMKLCVVPQGDKTLIQGKIWERGKDEPKDWSVTFEDPCPNKIGSAGLYGFATGVEGPKEPGTEIYYDNVKVAPNKK
jgi:outer membrane protein assembly factor BamB